MLTDTRTHIHARTGRRVCLACGADWGAPGPCRGRRAVHHRQDRERGAPRDGFAPLEANEDAGRPGGWG